jgi:hypothetical protein
VMFGTPPTFRLHVVALKPPSQFPMLPDGRNGKYCGVGRLGDDALGTNAAWGTSLVPVDPVGDVSDKTAVGDGCSLHNPGRVDAPLAIRNSVSA